MHFTYKFVNDYVALGFPTYYFVKQNDKVFDEDAFMTIKFNANVSTDFCLGLWKIISSVLVLLRLILLATSHDTKRFRFIGFFCSFSDAQQVSVARKLISAAVFYCKIYVVYVQKE